MLKDFDVIHIFQFSICGIYYVSFCNKFYLLIDSSLMIQVSWQNNTNYIIFCYHFVLLYSKVHR